MTIGNVEHPVGWPVKRPTSPFGGTILTHMSRIWLYVLQVFLVYGRNGWIGGLLGEVLKAQGAHWEFGAARLEDRAAILEDIQRVSCSLYILFLLNSCCTSLLFV